MSNGLKTILEREVQHIRNESLPRIYSVLDEIKNDIKAIFEKFNNSQNRQVVLETKVDIMGRFLWGFVTAGIACFLSILVWIIQLRGGIYGR